VPGDTMYLISQRLRINLSSLIAANPHITNPNVLFPGDVLCIPRQITFPCCVLLTPRVSSPPGTGGAALAQFDFSGSESVSVVATLPPPHTYGNFDVYLATVFIPEIGGFGNQLFPASDSPPTYAVTVSLPTVANLTPESRIVVEPFRTGDAATGPVVLEGNLGTCI
jgi:LysM repeat protein